MDVKIHDATVTLEVDTGATLSVISCHTYDTSWPSTEAPPLKPTKAKLCTYTDDQIPVDGAIEVDVTYQDQKASLNLLVVAGGGPNLMGQDWLRHFRLDWTQLHQVQEDP